ncbi:hypothetical protein FRC12_001019 [Ceratobasidium sp. 428]|nr:hypothetical protein FRC12_001019 [Ceratobasidium sp. 428]
MVILGYLPIPELSSEPDPGQQIQRAWETFHACMKAMLQLLKQASKNGIEIVCGDGGVRRCYPILASYIANHPERCLVACTVWCLVCEEESENMGDLGAPAPLQLKQKTLRALEDYEAGKKSTVTHLGLRPVWPFWNDLSNVNLARSLTPDLLHQLHKGIFLDHLLPWCRDMMGTEEMDRRFKSMTRYKGLRHFTNGISSVSQWTGREAREIAKVFLAVIEGKLTSKAIEAAQCVLDFMYLAHSSLLTDLELAEMDALLAQFHRLKHVFARTKDRKQRNFNLIWKLHMLRHYTYMIRQFGTPDGFNTEAPERLHINLAKDLYRASNKVNPMEQMATYVLEGGSGMAALLLTDQSLYPSSVQMFTCN